MNRSDDWEEQRRKVLSPDDLSGHDPSLRARLAELESLGSELRRSEAYLSEAQRLSHTGSFGWFVAKGEITWSDETYRIFEYAPSAKPTLDLVFERIHPDDKARVRQILAEASKCKGFDYEHRLLMPDGRIKWLHVRADAVEDSSGNVEFIGAVTDFTDRKNIEEESARRIERELRDVINTIPAIVWSALPDGSRDFVNQRWQEFTGLPMEAAMGWKWESTIHPSDIDRYRADTRAIIASREAGEIEARVRRADGEYRWWIVRVVPRRDEHGNIIKWYCTGLEIEDRKRAEQALRKSEQRWRHIFENNPIMYFMMAADGTVQAVNPIGAEQLGYTVDELLGQSVFKVFYEPDREAAKENFARSLNDLDCSHLWELRKVRKDGAILWVQEMARAVIIDQERVVFIACQDITQRKIAEETIRQQEIELRQVLDFTPQLVAVFGPDRERLYANQPTLDYFGVSLEEWRNIPDPLWFFHPEDLQRMAKDVYTGSLGEVSHEFEARMRKNDGTYRWFLFRDNPSRDEQGRIMRWYLSATDVEDRKRAEEERKAQVWFLESLDRINRATQRSNDLEQMMSDVLEAMLSIFDCDRAWLVYPCDPQAPSWRAVMECARPEFPGAFVLGTDLPIDDEVAGVFAAALASSDAVLFGPGYGRKVPVRVAARFAVRSFIAMAIYPKVDQPYLFGLHQCRSERMWTAQEQRLFQEAGRRLADSLTSLLTLRSLRDSEQVLRRGEAYLAEAQSVARTGSWAWDPHHDQMLHCSDEIFRIYGLDPEDGMPTFDQLMQRVHPEDRDSVRERTFEGARQKVEHLLDYRIMLPNGTVKYIQSVRRPVLNQAGDVIEIVGTSIDVTERKRAEEELRESETRFRTLLDQAADAIFVQDAEQGTIIDLNQQACASLGYTRQELIGKTPLIFDVDVDQAAMDAGERVFDRHWHRRKDGSTFPVEVQNNQVSYGGRRFLMKVARDISDRLQAEEALRRSQSYLAEAQRLTHTGSWAYDTSRLEVSHWSEETFRIWGFDPQQPLPDRDVIVQRVHPEDRYKAGDLGLRAIRDRCDYDQEFRIMLPDGTLKHIHVVGHPVFNARGELTELVGTHMDITERKRVEEERERLHQLEAELAHIDRITTLGELAASLSHELKQPIAAALTNAGTCLRWLARKEPDLTEAREAVARMVEDCKRATDIINRLRSFYTKGAPAERAPVDLNEVLNEMLAILRSEANRYSVAMRMELGSDLPLVRADRVQLQQVLMNLMLNGIEAMKETGGVLTIRSQVREDGQLMISVSDTGVGLPAGKAGQVFDAFFTTKRHGSGMGLAISRSLVESHGGRVWAESNPGGGAVFSFTLPVEAGGP
jgi:PAS domain S-box-containing protein